MDSYDSEKRCILQHFQDQQKYHLLAIKFAKVFQMFDEILKFYKFTSLQVSSGGGLLPLYQKSPGRMYQDCCRFTKSLYKFQMGREGAGGQRLGTAANRISATVPLWHDSGVS